MQVGALMDKPSTFQKVTWKYISGNRWWWW